MFLRSQQRIVEEKLDRLDTVRSCCNRYQSQSLQIAAATFMVRCRARMGLQLGLGSPGSKVGFAQNRKINKAYYNLREKGFLIRC